VILLLLMLGSGR